MNIRTKLILMLAIPIAALVLIAGVGFRDQSAEAERNEDTAEIAGTIIDLESIALEVADERLALVFSRLDPTSMSQSDLQDAITQTDAEIAAVAAGRSVLSGATGRPTVSDEVLDPLIVTLTQARTAGSTDGLPLYSEVLSDIAELVGNQPLTGFSADSLLAVQSIQSALEVADSQEAAWLRYFDLEDEVSPQDLAQITGLYDHVDFVQSTAENTELSNGLALLAGPANSDASGNLSRLQGLATEDLFQNTPGEIAPTEVLPELLTSRAQWSGAARSAQGFLLDDLATSADQIDDQRSLFTLFAVLGSLLLFTLVFVIGRSILGPLGRLLDHADITTNERLPFAVAKLRTLGSSDEAPELRSIPRETDDEIGLLVDAFNGMQDTAIKVATDQARSRRNVAEMFVSLGRRNQQLNHRMLNLITDLERDEQDSETLAGLYQLDHLATRMRRNAESLLVLAGNRSPRQWSRPVPMEDVVRSSLSEVELFERVVIGDLPQIAMQGNVVADVTHLLAELLDNATQFSEPSTSVNISAQETIEGVEIEVFDEGFGIGEQDLIELNERITNPPALDEAPSRLLGLFVVGRLSEQHGIHVELQSQPGVGTVATISIPNSLFAEELVDDSTAIKPPSALAGAAATGALAPSALPELPARRDLTAIEEIDIEEVVEAGGMPDIAAEDAEVSAPEVDAATAVDDAPAEIPAWDPAAVHEEQLADAAMPTMDEVNEAMPSFPGVTIDQPDSHVPGAPGADDAWPLTKLDEASTRGAEETAAPAPAVDMAPPVVEVEAPAPAVDMAPPVVEVEAPAPAVDMAPPVVEVEAPAPAVDMAPPVAEVEAPAPAVDMAPPVAEVEAPAPASMETPVIDPVQPPALEELPPIEPFSIAPPLPEVHDAPAPATAPAPSHNAASSLPAPPILDAVPPAPAPAAPAAEMPAAARPPAAAPMEAPVVESGSFGGLPTRSPQATIGDAAQTPAVMPLGDVAPEAVAAAPANPSAFAAFATGVNRGLNEVRDDATQVSNEGEEA